MSTHCVRRREPAATLHGIARLLAAALLAALVTGAFVAMAGTLARLETLPPMASLDHPAPPAAAGGDGRNPDGPGVA